MMTMKKIVMLSAAATLAVFTMATQAQEATTPAAAEAAAETNQPATEAAAEAAPAGEAIPEDSDHVKKLIALHPKLISRIAPYGKVCFDGEECDINITVLAPAVEGEARPGDQLYKAICATCHDAGLVGAPKVGNAGDWGSRIGKGKATLYDHAINGFGAMPARGGADISDDEVKNAVDYMIEQSS
ncbi:cytochrome c5 family protein [Moraxella bovoculi]|uniref:c-type cytochrome n=1 Tax=Moraxella bovoculi TaxID=386891 RepID=UPI00156E75BD|nr:c-type cytochrome [Moraxella bovoculi]NSM11003.1 cytochrome c5 family protein [Moraxella bovoculi]